MALIKIDGFDLYAYTRVAPGDGLDVADTDFLDPQFGDSAAGFGTPLINVQVNNREHTIPVHLRSNTGKDGLHTLVSDLNRRLSTAKILEWKDDGATNSSFLDIEFGRFEPEFNKRRQDAGWMSGIVRIFTRPYARKIASGYFAVLGSGVATGVSGSIGMPTSYSSDGPVALRWQITVPSVINTPRLDGRIVGAAIVPSGYIVDWPAASIGVLNGASLIGASGAAGSQVVAHSFYDTTGFSTLGDPLVRTIPFAQVILPNASVYAGRNRVLAVAQSRVPALTIAMSDDVGEWAQYPCAPSTIPGQGFTTLDLGILNVDPLVNATPVIRVQPYTTASASHRVEFAFGSLLASSVSPDFLLNRILIIPEESSQLVIDNSRRLVLGGFDAFNTSSAAAFVVDDFGNSATPVITVGLNIATYPLKTENTSNLVASNNVNGAALDLITSRMTNNLSGTMDFRSSGHGGLTTIYSHYAIGKHCYPNWFGARVSIAGNGSISFGSGALNIVTGNPGIYSGTSGLASVLASVPFNIGTTVSGGARIRLRFQQQGPVLKADVVAQAMVGGALPTPYISTATCSASIAFGGLPGVGYIGLAQLSNDGIAYFDFSEVPSTGIRGGDVYTVDTGRRFANRGVTSRFPLVSELKGGFLNSQPNATAVGAFVPFVLPLDGGPTNQDWTFTLSYNEQFTYAV